jgi:2-C-methyl-D-erythritol 2,4-cyclodiphosphate synthase
LIRTGIGVDSHRFEAGRALVLGGVDIPHEEGLAGHSDADVLSHAIIDALLGAAAMGDIGMHFPDTDERWRDADSLALLRAVVEGLAEHGYRIVNIDATVMLERPRLAPYREAIVESLASALGVGASRMSLKATTGEGLGFVGRQEGAACMAIATLDRPEEHAATP